MDSERRKSVEELLEKLIELQQEQSTYTLESLGVQRDTQSEIQDALALLEQIFEALVPPADPVTTGFTISQIDNGGIIMAITGVVAGASGTFQYSLLPAGSLGLKAGTVATFSADDPSVTLGPSPDGDVTKVVASVPATDTGASFNLTVSGTNTAGTAISSVF